MHQHFVTELYVSSLVFTNKPESSVNSEQGPWHIGIKSFLGHFKGDIYYVANYIFTYNGEKGVAAQQVSNMHCDRCVNMYLFIEQKPFLSDLVVNNVYKNV